MSTLALPSARCGCIALGALLLSSTTASAQAKVVTALEQLENQRVGIRYYDRHQVPLPDAKGAHYYDILRRADSLGVKWRVRRFSIPERRLVRDVGFSSEVPGQTLHARSREWYPGGQLREDVSYRLGKPDGPMKTYYPDGKLRRDQQNRAGAVVKSECFTSAGQAVEECPPFRTAARLAGRSADQAAVFKSLQRQFEQFLPKGYSRPTDGTVHVAFRVDSLGYVRDPRILSSDDAPLSAAALEAVRRLPRFTPASEEGQPAHDVLEGYFYYYPTRRAATASEE